MTIFIRVKTHIEHLFKCRCTKCGSELVSQISDEHLALLMMEHAEDHDRK